MKLGCVSAVVLLFTVSQVQAADLEKCTPAAAKSLVYYLNHHPGNLRGTKWHHQLWRRSADKNGYRETIYTYLYKVSDGSKPAIARVVLNTRCQMLTFGAYASLQEMNERDQDMDGGLGAFGNQD